MNNIVSHQKAKTVSNKTALSTAISNKLVSSNVTLNKAASSKAVPSKSKVMLTLEMVYKAILSEAKLSTIYPLYCSPCPLKKCHLAKYQRKF